MLKKTVITAIAAAALAAGGITAAQARDGNSYGRSQPAYAHAQRDARHDARDFRRDRREVRYDRRDFGRARWRHGYRYHDRYDSRHYYPRYWGWGWGWR